MDHDSTRRTADAPTAGAASAARRARPGGWQTVVPTAVVLLVLVALVVLPYVHAQLVRPAHDLMRDVAEPARDQVTRLHVALALEGSLLGDYVETGDPAVLSRYREAVRHAREATARLAPLTEGLDATVRARFVDMARAQDEWQAAAERELAASTQAGDLARQRHDGDEYEDLLLAAARLDEAIGLEVRQSRSLILAAERRQVWVSLLLALLGFTGAGAVAWLARRLQQHAGILEEQRAALARATERRARLLRGVSHDLKNPMHAIDGHAQLLEDGILGPLQPAQVDSVARIRRGVRSMLTLVEDLLELSRAEAGHLPVRLGSLDLAALVSEAVDEHRGSARAAGHQLALAIAEPVPATIVSDPERVRQVLGNLLSNAVKYTPSGGSIAVRVERRARTGVASPRPWLAIDVSDTGPGIPGDQLESIFDEFARLPMHVGLPGSGLGLAIARRIARLLGGDLTLRDQQQGGACFTLWLPIDAAT